MEEQLPTTQTAPATEVQPMSFSERLVNVFASPGELFENVRLTPKTASNWIIPIAIMIVVALAMQQIIMSNPSLVDQTKTMIDKAARERLDKEVQSGKKTPEAAEQEREQIARFSDPTSTFSIIMRVVSVVLFIPIVLLLISLVYWLMGLWAMRAQAPYAKVLEVMGLTLLIAAVESIVTTVMAIGLDSIHAGPNLAVFVQNFDVGNKLHVALSKVNVFTIWSLVVTSIGLSKIFQRDLPKVLVLVFALWILWSVATVMFSFLTFGA